MALHLYAADTPNNRKITIALAEMEIAYRAVPMDLGAGDQHAPAFRAISPSGKTPALVETGAGPGYGGQPLALFESGAILTYLAERSGRFLAADGTGRATALAWTFWQASALGPTLGQAWHFAHSRGGAEASPYAFRRFMGEGQRLWGVMEARLAQSAHLGDEAMTIADMAAYPWIAPSRRLLGLAWEDHPGLRRWWEMMRARPGVQAGMRALRRL